VTQGSAEQTRGGSRPGRPGEISYLNECRAPLHLGVHYSTIRGARWMAFMRRQWTNPHRLSLLNGAPIHLWVSEPPVPTGRPPPALVVCRLQSAPGDQFGNNPGGGADLSVFSISRLEFPPAADGFQMRCAKLWAIAYDFSQGRGVASGSSRVPAASIFARAATESDLSKVQKCCCHVKLERACGWQKMQL
jgi:hypothetical protein